MIHESFQPISIVEQKKNDLSSFTNTELPDIFPLQVLFHSMLFIDILVVAF